MGEIRGRWGCAAVAAEPNKPACHLHGKLDAQSASRIAAHANGGSGPTILIP